MKSKSSLICVTTDFVELNLDWEVEQYSKAGVEFRYNQLRFADSSGILAVAADADVLIVDQAAITEEVIQGLSRCKLIIRHGDGYDNLDLEAATEAGIICINQPGFWSREVAEQAFSLGLSLALRIPLQQSVAANCAPGSRWDLGAIMPYRSLSSLSVGIVGCGRIGTHTASLYHGVTEKLLVCDPYVDSDRINHTGGRPVSLDELLSESDIVSIHTPATAKTVGMFDSRRIGSMKEGAMLVNTARGAVVDTPALVEALGSGRLGGAALDSTQPEPLPPGHPLFKLPNVIITPHMGWYSEDALFALRRSIVNDVLGVAGGRIPDTVVNPDVLKRENLRLK